MQATATISNTTTVTERPARRTNLPLDRCTSQELLERSQAGDIDARHALVGRYKSIIHATANRMAGSRHDADDLAAEIYIHVFEVINSCKNVQTLPGWIKRIAMNEFYQKCRRQKTRPQYTSLESLVEDAGDSVLGSDDTENPATLVIETAFREERSERIRKALVSLPEHHRQLCEMYYAQRRSFEDIARETGLAIGTIKSRLFRARESMQRKLGDLAYA
ncbi:MAG: sigma-70 family RNA polymerase sigma factor [Armatimonas sp.]